MSTPRVILRITVAVVAATAIALGVRWWQQAGEGNGAHAAPRESQSAKSDTPAAKPGAPGGPRMTPVMVAPVEKRDVPVWLEGLGTVAAWQSVTVRTQVDGRLDAVLFKEGQTVHRGDALAQIDPRPFVVQLHNAEGQLARDKAQHAAAVRDLARYKQLAANQLGTQQQADDQLGTVGQLEGTIRVDEAAIESARLNLDYAKIRAPIDGIVGVRMVDAGNVVHQSDPNGLVVLTQLDPAAVFLTLPEDELPAVTAAQRRGAVPIEVWSRDGGTLLGKGALAVIDNTINSATATLRIKSLVPNHDRALWPNQFVKARLLVDTRRGALVVPAAAIQRGPSGTFVYLIDKSGKAEVRPVSVAITTADDAIVDKGVTAGESVVVEGQNQLRPGALATPRPWSKGGMPVDDKRPHAGNSSP